MTTKAKIILGFALMVLIIGVLASIGYKSAYDSGNGVNEYARLAAFNTTTSDMATELYNATSEVNKFMITRDTRYVDEAKNAVRRAEDMSKMALSLSHRESTKKVVIEMGEGIHSFLAIIDGVQDAVSSMSKQYETNVVKSAQNLQNEFTNFTQASIRANDIEGLILINNALNNLSAANSSISRFAVGRAESDMTATQENIKQIRTAIDAIKRNVISERGKQMMRVLDSAFDVYSASFEELRGRAASVENALQTMDRVFDQELGDMRALNEARDKQMREYGENMRENSLSVQNGMMILGILGLVIGIVVAFFIVMGLIKVLKNLSGFAMDVSRGNFSAPITVKEGGEIGAMVLAMQAIPDVLSKVMDDARRLSRTILAGGFRARMDSKAYEGGFSRLTDTFNIVSDAYTGVLDLMPVPIKTCSTQKRILFLNSIAQKTLGGNFINEPCAQHVKSGVCNSPDCFGERCMSNDGTVSGEIVIHPQNNSIESSVTALPLNDQSGALVGYIELINDISSLKEKENTIVNVANQASAIADRVAAASEEIAAQVEEITRGAEFQRTRVETTASAMSEMNSTVLEVARNAGEASESSDITRQRAQEGSSRVTQVVASIQTVNEVAKQMQINMQELGGQAESIGSVMSVISDIADQTNLLALNAAIEAARAGEAGRGFAVVADEVRKLAEKTMTATQEVGDNINAIQATTRRNIEAMESVAKGVSDATSLASSSGETLTEIVSLASDNSSVVASIATAAEEQSATSEEINRAIEEINKIVGETTEGMVQSAAAVQELSSMTQELRNIIDSLR